MKNTPNTNGSQKGDTTHRPHENRTSEIQATRKQDGQNEVRSAGGGRDRSADQNGVQSPPSRR